MDEYVDHLSHIIDDVVAAQIRIGLDDQGKLPFVGLKR
jgi:hypothetical protein